MTQSPYSHYSPYRSKKESSTSKALLGALSGTVLGYGGGRLLGGIPLGADDRGQWNNSRSITSALVGIPVGAGLGALIGSLKQDDQENDDARTASKNKKTKKSSYRSKSANENQMDHSVQVGPFELGFQDIGLALTNDPGMSIGISKNRDFNPNEILGMGGIGGGLAGGLGGAGIGALIQALRGKSKLKGALIGGGIGGVTGAGLGLEGANRYNTDKMLSDVIRGTPSLNP